MAKKRKKEILVQKRDGREVLFSSEKIFNALKQAFSSIKGESIVHDEDIMNLTSKILRHIAKEAVNGKISVEKIQDIVEDVLLRAKENDVAKEYIRYRAKRTQIRDANNDLMRLYNDIYFKSAEDVELKRNNANVNGNSPMGTMLQIGSEGNKYFLLNRFLKPEYANAHKEGWVHFHDCDFSLLCFNCQHIDLEKLFANGFSTGHGFLRSPNSIRSYSALAAIAIQSSQNDMFGGQSLPAFDWVLSDGVRKSFITLFKKNLKIAAKTILKESDIFDNYLEQITWENKDSLPKYNDENSLNEIINQFIENNEDDLLSSRAIIKAFKFAFEQAQEDTEEETWQAMEAFVHNANTLASRAGAQVNMGL